MAFTREDVVKDTPTNTFATWNSIDGKGTTTNLFTFSEGNIKITHNTTGQWQGTTGTLGVKTGKWYYELQVVTAPTNNNQNYNFGFVIKNTTLNYYYYTSTELAATGPYGNTTRIYIGSNNSITAPTYGTLASNGDIYQAYLDLDNKTIQFGLNNTWYSSYSLAELSNYEFLPVISSYAYGTPYGVFIGNFGQDPTFASTKVPTKVYTDASGHGRFFYEPPAGAMALCTANLDTANLQPAEYIVDETNQHMLTYNGNAQISKFSPYATDGWSINFDSNIASSQVRTPVHSDLEFGTNHFTVEFWLYHMGGDSYETIVSYPQWQGGGSTNGTAWQIRLSNTDYLITDYGNKSSWVFNGNHTDLYVKRHQWNHIVLQRNGTAIKIYCNGKPSSTQYNIGTGSITDALTGFNTNFLCIGGYSGNSQDLGGYIADFRIVKGTAVYTPDGNGYISAPNAKLTAITNTKFLLSVDSKGFEDSSGTNKTVTINSSPSISDWSPYQRSNDFDTAFFRAKDNYYGGSFKLDGNGDKLDMGDNEDWSLSNGDFTFRFWMYGTNNSIQTQHVFAKWNSNKEIRAFFEGSASNRYTTFWFQYKTSSTPQDPWVDGGKFDNLPITPNSWNYFVFVNSGGTTSLYVNGASMTPTNNTISGTIYNSTDSLWIGSSGDANAGFAGHIADFEFEKTAISNPTDVPTNKVTKNSNTKLLLQPWHTKTSAGVMSLIDSYAQDETGKSLTYVGNAAVSASSPYKSGDYGSFSFNNTSSLNYIKLAQSSDWTPGANSPYTIEFWYKSNVSIGTNNPILTTAGWSSNFLNRWQIVSNSDKIAMWTSNGSGNTFVGATSLTPGKWYHVAVVQDASSNWKLYLNGVQDASGTDSGYTTDSYLEIGANSTLGSTYGVKGVIADLRIVKGVALYTADFTPPTEPLTQTNETVLLAQPGKVTKRNNVAAQDPEKHFKAVTYDGNGGTKTVTGIEFQPDFVWIKSRSNSYGHNIHDVIRGPDSYLSSHSTVAENTDYANICVLNSNGFALSSSSSGNVTGTTNVAWCWKAGGAPSGDDKGVVDGVERTITGDAKLDAGTITPTRMSVNTKAGFSIVKYVGTGSAATVPHGLSSAPDLIIAKNLDDTANWLVYHKSLSSNIHYLHLELPNSEASNSAFWSGFSANTFTLGNSNHINGLSDDIIAYCWHSVAGYSAFGSFSGNNSTDGPFIYTGFKPAFLMVKLYTGTSNADYHSWVMYDNSRITNNPNHSPLYANRSHAEGKRGNTAGDSGGDTLYLDLLSNGFKCRQNGTELNGNGGANDKFIYAAFAEQPIKFSNAR